MTHDLVERLREIKRGAADVRVVAGRASLIVPYGNMINDAADKLEAYMAEIAALRAEKDELRKATIEEAATIAYVEAVKHCSARDGKTLIGHPVGQGIAAAIRRLGERDNARDCDKLSVRPHGENHDAEFQTAKRATEEPAASGDGSIEGAGQASIPSRHPGTLLGERPRANDQSGDPNLRYSLAYPTGRAALEKEPRDG